MIDATSAKPWPSTSCSGAAERVAGLSPASLAEQRDKVSLEQRDRVSLVFADRFPGVFVPAGLASPHAQPTLQPGGSVRDRSLRVDSDRLLLKREESEVIVGLLCTCCVLYILCALQ